MQAIDYDIDNMLIMSHVFEKKLKGLAELAESTTTGNKLGIVNEETYISWWYLQGIQRTLYGESVDKLLTFFKTTFDDYFIFIIMLRRAIDLINDKRLLLLRRENTVLCQKWKLGIEYLKKEYAANEHVQKQFDECLVNLL